MAVFRLLSSVSRLSLRPAHLVAAERIALPSLRRQVLMLSTSAALEQRHFNKSESDDFDFEDRRGRDSFDGRRERGSFGDRSRRDDFEFRPNQRNGSFGSGGRRWDDNEGRYRDSFRDRASGGSFERNRSSQSMTDFGEGLEERADWDMSTMSKIKKCIYEPSEAVKNMSPAEVDCFRAENSISLVRDGGRQLPNPVLSLDDCGLSPAAINTMRKLGMERPMPIQAQGWPIVMSGCDLVGIGQTGSGKTLGFLLPAVEHIKQQDQGNSKNPKAIVLAPTRELAVQIHSVSHKFEGPLRYRSACLYGGSGKAYQTGQLRDGVDLVVGTPGRIIDLLSTGHLRLDDCSFAVLDEADRMLDMGFEPQIRKILGQIRPDRQMQMWSATWPRDVCELAEDFFADDYVHLNIGSTELAANHNIEQIVDVVEKEDKFDKLISFLKERIDPGSRTLIFGDTKRVVDYLESRLSRSGFKARGIHGDKTQSDRTRLLKGFRQGHFDILIATNVAARGLDVDDIKCVINYDYPNCSEDYIHRIGRTGRRDKKGVAYTLFTPDDAKLAKDLLEVLSEANQEINPDLADLASPRRKGPTRMGRWDNLPSHRYNAPKRKRSLYEQ